MGLVYLPRRKIRPDFLPDFPVELDSDKQTAKGWYGVWLANHQGDKLYNASASGIGHFEGISSEISAGRLSLGTDEHGKYIQGIASTTQSSLNNSTTDHPRFDESGSMGYTVLLILRCGTQNNGPQALFSVGGAANGYGLRFNTAPDVFAYYHISDSGGDLDNQNGTITYTGGEYVVIAMSFNPDGSFASYHNGELDYSTTGLGIISSHTAEPELFGVNTGILPTQNQWEGQIYGYALRDRFSTEEELRQLSLDPYMILRPRRQELYVPVTAGGATVSVGLSSETDTGLAVTVDRSYAVGQSTETQSALAITPVKTYSVGISQETDTSLPLTLVKSITSGLPEETDSAFSVTVSGDIQVGLSTETDTALSVSKLKEFTLGLASETEQGFDVTVDKTYQAGLSSEVDSSFAVSIIRALELGLVTETDAALSLSLLRTYTVGLSSETDSALTVLASAAEARTSTGGFTTAVVTTSPYTKANITTSPYNKATVSDNNLH